MFSRLCIVAFEQATMAEFGAGHTGDHDAVDDQRRAGHRVAVRVGHRVRRTYHPDLIAGLGIERDESIVHECADDHAFVNSGAAIDDAAANHAQRLRRIFVDDTPDLLASERIHRRRRVVGRHVDDAILDDGK